MTIMDWAGIAVSVMTLIMGFAGLVRWLVKHYLAELKTNGGSSVKDQVNRLEMRVDEIYRILCEKDQPHLCSIRFSIWSTSTIFICTASPSNNI